MSRVILDCTAGERGGREALEAGATASLQRDGASLVLLGDETDISRALEHLEHDAERIRVVHAPDRLDPTLAPRAALSKAPESAICKGLELVGEIPGATLISAAEPGPIVLEATRRLQLLPGVRRAALAAVYPTLRHRGEREDPFALLLDVGATPRCEAADLVLFAAMGAAYARKISVIARPRVALLANSERPDAAPPAIQEAHRQLEALKGDFEYIGPIRADQVTRGDADVVVSDGFTGDVIIRTLEGVVATAYKLLEHADARFSWRLGLQMLGSGLERLKALVDWENYGGAPLLGYNHNLILTQSNSHQRAFINAIRLAVKLERMRVLDEVRASVGRLRAAESLDDG